MSKETLHTLRLIIPGLMLLIILILLLQRNQGIIDIKISSENLLYIFVVFGIGVIYYVINPRMLIMKNSLKKIQENIKDKLLAPFAEDPQIKNSIMNLREGDKLTNIFYHFIDSDESLKERTKEVYFNGLIWSSIADLIIISPIGTIVFIVAFIFTQNLHLILLAGICIAILILMIFLISPVVKRHISISNYQLRYIIDMHKKELHDQLISII